MGNPPFCGQSKIATIGNSQEPNGSQRWRKRDGHLVLALQGQSKRWESQPFRGRKRSQVLVVLRPDQTSAILCAWLNWGERRSDATLL